MRVDTAAVRGLASELIMGANLPKKLRDCMVSNLRVVF
jgi:hypothetical protein